MGERLSASISGRPPTPDEFLQLFAPYLEADLIEKVVEELAVVRRGGFRAPPHILIILFASRAGSNFLGQLLCGTGWFNEIGESFAPHQLIKIRERYGLRDVHEAAQWMIDNRGTANAFGFKGGFYVLSAAAELGFLTEIIDRAQIVLLRRRDRVAQAVSRVKGRLTGRMHSRQPEGRILTDADYDADAIAWHVGRTLTVERQLAEFAELIGKDAPVVFYEDICDRPEEHVAMVCDRLGLPMPEDYDPASKIRLSILRDDLSHRWVERFRSERPDIV